MLENKIKNKINKLQDSNKTAIAFNRDNTLQYNNYLIKHLEEILSSNNIKKELNNKIDKLSQSKKIDENTNKYTYTYNVYLDLKRLKK